RLARVPRERWRALFRLRRGAAGRVHGARRAVRVAGAPVHRVAGRATRGDRRARHAARRGPAASPGRDHQPVQRDRHGPLDRPRDQELDPPGRVHEPAQGTWAGHARRRGRGRPHPAAADSHDVGSDHHGRDPGHDRDRRWLDVAPAARLRDRGRHLLLHGAHIVRGTRRVRAAGPPDGAPAKRRACGTTGGGRLMLALLALLQLQAAAVPSIPGDSLPTVTLAEALRRATGLDPNYVAALGQVDNARWARRSAFAVFLLPAVAVNADIARPNPQSINFVTFQPVAQQVTAQLTARYDLVLGGQTLA